MKHNTKLPSAFIEQYLDVDKKSEDYAIAKELVENLFCGMAKLCKKYDNETFCELPYTYSERRLDCVLLPVLSKLCEAKVLVEFPTIRRPFILNNSEDETSGRIDYWCAYKGYSFVIELKHSFDCFTTPKTREDKVTSRWVNMINQLDSVKNEIKEYEEDTKGVIRLGLHFITSYSDKEPNQELIRQFTKSIPDTFERFKRDLAQKHHSLRPDLLICWKIPHQIVLDGDQTFPGLWAIAKFYPKILHRGAKK